MALSEECLSLPASNQVNKVSPLINSNILILIDNVIFWHRSYEFIKSRFEAVVCEATAPSSGSAAAAASNFAVSGGMRGA